jgi:hypothetical protein
LKQEVEAFSKREGGDRIARFSCVLKHQPSPTDVSIPNQRCTSFHHQRDLGRS